MKLSFKVILSATFLLLTTSVFAHYEIKAKQIAHTGSVDSARITARNYASWELGPSAYNGVQKDVHVLKVTGYMTDESGGPAKFRTIYYKAIFLSNVTYVIDTSNATEFINAQITQGLQKELDLFAIELWNEFVTSYDGSGGFEVISFNGKKTKVKANVCQCGKVIVTVIRPKDDATPKDDEDGEEQEP
ncbi:hypothetical protein PN836_014785 [Ningiella sp. W23]|uniref:hypothetical protein n=1 Tax=Ningiella sp. W23 TaxID=3023715 RepID=UPI0037577D11